MVAVEVGRGARILEKFGKNRIASESAAEHEGRRRFGLQPRQDDIKQRPHTTPSTYQVFSRHQNLIKCQMR